MKKLTSVMALTAFLLTSASGAFAQSSAPLNVDVTASVASLFQLGMTIKEETGKDSDGNPVFGPAVTSMNHGILTNVDQSGLPTNNALRGKAFHVFLGPIVNDGRQYTVTSTTTALSGTAGTLPHSVGVFGVSAKDGLGVSTGTLGILLAGEDAVSMNRTVYTSNATGKAVTIELVYGYSGGNQNGSAPFTGWQATPPDQATGTYDGTIKYTLTA